MSSIRKNECVVFCVLTKNCDAVSYHDGNTQNNFGKHLGDSKTSNIKIESSTKYQELVLLRNLIFFKTPSSHSL